MSVYMCEYIWGLQIRCGEETLSDKSWRVFKADDSGRLTLFETELGRAKIV